MTEFTINAPTHDVSMSYVKYANDFVNKEIVEEPLMTEEKRLIPRPILYPTLRNNWLQQLDVHWIHSEVDFSLDVRHWQNVLSADERHLLEHVLAFFASFDNIVNCNIRYNIIDKLTAIEAEYAYCAVMAIENIHSEIYAIKIETLVPDSDRRKELFDSITTMPVINKKAIWCRKWIESDYTIAHKILAFAIVEGIFFSSAFAIIFWFKTKPNNIMPGLTVANEFISRDEALHVKLAASVYELLKNKLKPEVVRAIVEEAVEIESEFVRESLRNRLLGINSDLMIQYVKYVADTLMVQLGYEKIYNCSIGLEYMAMIGLPGKSNFFERRNSEYASSKSNPKKIEELEDF